MVKFIVTDELSFLIKTFRQKSKTTAKTLSIMLEKSQSYISKLENKEIKSIQEPELTSIFRQLIPGDDFWLDKLPAVLQAYNELFGKQNLEQQIWLLHYDAILRPLPVPPQMIDDLNARLERLGITRSQLASLIEENRDSGMSSAFPSNQFVEYNLKGTMLLLLRFQISEADLSALLDKNLATSHYYILNGLAFMGLRLDKFGDKKLAADQAAELMRATAIYLDSYGVYSLADYNRTIEMRNVIGKEQALLTVFDATNSEVINEIVDLFQAASECDLLNTIKDLSAFRDNLQWDCGFMFKLICQPYDNLGRISFSLKKQLLEEMEALLRKYDKIPDVQKTFESY